MMKSKFGIILAGIIFAIALAGCGNGNNIAKLNEYIANGDNDAAKEMIDSGIDLNKTNNNAGGRLFSIFTQGGSSSCTPLYTACEEGNNEMIVYLLENGADPNITGYHQNYPLEKYYENNRHVDDRVLEAMLNADVDVNLYESMAPICALLRQYKDSDSDTRRGLEAHLIVLLENGANWEDWAKGLSETNATPFHYAIGYGESEFVAALIENPETLEYINTQDECGGTPLIAAAKNGQVECYNLLLEAGADETLIDNEGKTAQDYLN